MYPVGTLPGRFCQVPHATEEEVLVQRGLVTEGSWEQQAWEPERKFSVNSQWLKPLILVFLLRAVPEKLEDLAAEQAECWLLRNSDRSQTISEPVLVTNTERSVCLSHLIQGQTIQIFGDLRWLEENTSISPVHSAGYTSPRSALSRACKTSGKAISPAISN